MQRKCRGFLEAVGVQYTASVDQVVRHLVFCAHSESDLAPGILVRINQQAAEANLEPMHGVRCIPAGEVERVRPEDLFRGPHRFGRFRFSVADTLDQYSSLWRELGVPDVPRPQHAMAVLQDIADELGQRKTSVSQDDLAVIQQCWAMLDEPDEFVDMEDLTDVKCALNASGRLVEPVRLFIDDSPSRAKALSERLGDSLIQPPAEGRRAMTAAGVRSLLGESQSAVDFVGQPTDAPAVMDHLRARQRQLWRVFAFSGHAEEFARFLETTSSRSVAGLAVTYSISLGPGSQTIESDLIECEALVNNEILYVRNAELVDWATVAKAVAVAISPDAVPSVYPHVRVVLEATTLSEADAELDEAEIPALGSHLADVVEGAELNLSDRDGFLAPETKDASDLDLGGSDRDEIRSGSQAAVEEVAVVSDVDFPDATSDQSGTERVVPGSATGASSGSPIQASVDEDQAEDGGISATNETVEDSGTGDDGANDVSSQDRTSEPAWNGASESGEPIHEKSETRPRRAKDTGTVRNRRSASDTSSPWSDNRLRSYLRSWVGFSVADDRIGTGLAD